MGFGYEIYGGLSALTNTSPFDEDYAEKFRSHYRGAYHAREEWTNPIIQGIGEAAPIGSLWRDLGKKMISMGSRSLLPAIGRGAAAGSATGAVGGAGYSQPGERVGGSLIGGELGGVIGVAIPGATGVAGRGIARLRGKRQGASAPSATRREENQVERLHKKASEEEISFLDEETEEFVADLTPDTRAKISKIVLAGGDTGKEDSDHMLPRKVSSVQRMPRDIDKTIGKIMPAPEREVLMSNP